MIGDIPELSLADLYSKSIADFSNRPAFTLNKKYQLSYKEFGAEVNKLVDIFNKYGLNSGDKIAILGSNMPNWAVSYFAITTSSRVVVPVLPDFTSFEIVNIMEHSEAKALIVSSKLQYKIPENLSNKLSLIILMDNFEVIKENTDAKIVVPEKPSYQELASIIYTSGTSGASKGVMLSHSNLVAMNQLAQVLFPIDENDVFHL